MILKRYDFSTDSAACIPPTIGRFSSTASNKDANIDLFQYMELGYGVGLRFMMNKTSRTNITLDYAWGGYGAQGLFLNVNETF